MNDLVVVFLAGFAASMVDGALGMGFGPTSASILLGSGLSPAAVSTTVNLAKVATGISAAVSHWRFDNVHRRLVKQLAIPGCFGAVIGVTVLANVDAATMKPILSALLLVMAARILYRFSRPLPPAVVEVTGHEEDAPYLGPATQVAAAAGGVTNGMVGAWGPVVTPFLLHRGLAPRFAVGSVNTAEVAVAIVASGSLLSTVGGGGIDASVVAAMLLGGVLAAPLAAWSIRFLPPRAMGVAVAGLLFVTNIRELAGSAGVGAQRWIAYACVVLACAYAGVRPRLLRPAYA